MEIDYTLTSCSIAQDKNGKAYLATRCVSQESGDNGFSLNFFNQEYVKAFQRLAATGMLPHEIAEQLTNSLKKKGAHVESRTVQLKAAYIRCKRQQKQVNGETIQEILKDTPEEDAKPIKSLDVHCIYTIPMEDAFYTEGPLKGTPIFVDKYIDGVRQTVPVKRAVLDDVGQPMHQYWRTWAPEERAESTLEALYMLAPQDQQGGAEEPKPEQQAAPKVAQQPDDDPFAAAVGGEA